MREEEKRRKGKIKYPLCHAEAMNAVVGVLYYNLLWEIKGM